MMELGLHDPVAKVTNPYASNLSLRLINLQCTRVYLGLATEYSSLKHLFILTTVGFLLYLFSQ